MLAKHNSMVAIGKEVGRNQATRPFNSTQRVHFQNLHRLSGPGGNLFISGTIFPRKDRDGGPTGQEELAERLLVQAQATSKKAYGPNQDGKPNTKAKEAKRIQSSKLAERALDRRRAKVEVTTAVFGKPNILIRNDPNFQSEDLEAEGDFDDLMAQQTHETMKPAEIEKYLTRAEKGEALTTLTNEL